MERKYYADLLRVIAIIQVISIHVSSGFFGNVDLIDTYPWRVATIVDSISRTGVPIFIMISGMLLLDKNKNYDIKVFFKKRVSKIIIPFIFWGIFYFVKYGNKMNFEGIKKFILALVTNNIFYHLPFMYIIIGLYLITPILNVFVKNATQKQLWYFEILCWIVGGVIPFINEVFKINIGIQIPMVGNMVGLFVLGYLLDNIKFNKKTRYAIYLLGAISILLTIVGTYYFSIKTGTANQILYNNGGVNIIIIASSIFILCRQIYYKYKINDKFNIIIANISKLSFGIYLLHVHIVLSLEQSKIPLLLPQYMPCTFYGLLMRVITVFIITYIIVYVISKIKYLNKIV